MDVLLVTEDSQFRTVVPSMDLLTGTTHTTGYTVEDLSSFDIVDVALIDARDDVRAACDFSRRLTGSAPSVAIVFVVSEASVARVHPDWHFDEVVLAGAGAAEVDARVRLAVARRRSASDSTLTFGDLVLRPGSYTASIGNRPLALTLTEFKLLNYLVQHAGRAFTRKHLMHEVWGYVGAGRARTVDVHVQRLRHKLGAYEGLIVSVRGVGYMAAPQAHPRWTVAPLRQRLGREIGAARKPAWSPVARRLPGVVPRGVIRRGRSDRGTTHAS